MVVVVVLGIDLGEDVVLFVVEVVVEFGDVVVGVVECFVLGDVGDLFVVEVDLVIVV